MTHAWQAIPRLGEHWGGTRPNLLIAFSLSMAFLRKSDREIKGKSVASGI